MKVEDLFVNLQWREGLWHAPNIGDVSYPEVGNEVCFEIEDKSFWFVHRNKCIHAVVEKYLSPGQLFLDVGGGNGFVAQGLEKNGYETVLLEPFLAGCVNAKARGLKNVVHGDLLHTNFPKDSFDAVGIFDVLEHIPNRRDFLNAIHRILRPGGKLFIAVPAFQWLWSDEDHEAGHFLRYTKRVLNQETEEVGFTELFSSYFFSLLVLPIGLFRVLPSKLKMKRKDNTGEDHSEAVYLQRALRFEIKRLRKGKSLGVGSSLIGVYEKQ